MTQVFAAVADLETFLATIKYVDMEEMAVSCGPESLPSAVTGDAAAAGPESSEHQPAPGAGGCRGASGGGSAAGSGGDARKSSLGGNGMQWAEAAYRLMTAEGSACAGGERAPAVSAHVSHPSLRIPPFRRLIGLIAAPQGAAAESHACYMLGVGAGVTTK
jgi:hypothetical protein